MSNSTQKTIKKKTQKRLIVQRWAARSNEYRLWMGGPFWPVLTIQRPANPKGFIGLSLTKQLVCSKQKSNYTLLKKWLKEVSAGKLSTRFSMVCVTQWGQRKFKYVCECFIFYFHLLVLFLWVWPFHMNKKMKPETKINVIQTTAVLRQLWRWSAS